MIPDAAVEAAARAMSPAVWGPSVWTFVAHGESPTDARSRVQRQSLEDARRALEAAAPHMLTAASERAMQDIKALMDEYFSDTARIVEVDVVMRLARIVGAYDIEKIG